jgi:hypothetical protein
MAFKRDPWWTHTWWGKRTTAVNVSITVGVLLILLWITLYR